MESSLRDRALQVPIHAVIDFFRRCVIMQTALTIQCEYSEGKQILEELIQASFCSFLKKELIAVAICRNV